MSPRKDTIKVVPALIVVVAIMLATIPVWRLVRGSMERLREALITQLAQQTGYSISYRRLSPSLLRSLQIHDLRISEGERDIFYSPRIRIFYDLRQLLSSDRLAALKEIRINNSTLVIDNRRERQLLENLFTTYDEDGRACLDDLRITGRNLRVDVGDADLQYGVDDLFFDIAINGCDVALEGRGALTVRDPRLPDELADLQVSLAVDGYTDINLESARADLTIEHLSTPLLELQKQSFRLRYAADQLSIRKVGDDVPLDLVMEASLDSGRLQVQLDTERFEPADFLSLRGGLRPFDLLLAGSYIGSAQLEFDPETQNLSYDVNLEGRVGRPTINDTVTVTVDATGDQRQVDFNSISMRTESGRAQFSGTLDIANLRAEGGLEFSQFGYAGLGSLTGMFDIRQTDQQVIVQSSGVDLGHARLQEIRVAIKPDRLITGVSAAIIFDSQGTKRLNLTADLSNLVDRPSRFEASFEGIDPLDLYHVTGGIFAAANLPALNQLRDNYAFDGRIFVELRGDSLQFATSGMQLYDRSRPQAVLSFSLQGNERGFELPDILLNSADYRLESSIVGNIMDDGAVDIGVDLQLRDVAYRLQTLFVPGRSVIVSGSHATEIEVWFNTADRIVLKAHTEELLIPLSEDRLLLSLDVGGSYRSGQDWSARIEDLTVQYLNDDGERLSETKIAARFDASGGSLENIVFNDSISRLVGSGTIGYSEIVTFNLQLRSQEDAERYDLTARYTDGEIRALLTLADIPLRRLGSSALGGVAQGNLTITGTLASPTIELQFQVIDGLLNTDSFTVSGSALLQDRVVTLRGINLRYFDIDIRVIEGGYDLRSGRLTITTRVAQTTMASTVDNNSDDAIDLLIQITTQLAPWDATAPLSFGIPTRVDIEIDGIRVGDERQRWDFVVQRRRQAYTISGAPGDALIGRLFDDGRFTLQGLMPLPVRFRADGTIADGRIEVDIIDFEAYPAELTRIIDLGILRFTGGRLSGVMRIVGPITDPDFYGTLFADGARAEMDFIPDPIGPTSGFLVLQGKILQVYRFDAHVEDSAASVEIEVVFDHWRPVEFRVEVEVTEEQRVHVDYVFGRIHVEGYVGANLLVLGKQQSSSSGAAVPFDIAVEGTIIARDGTILVLSEEAEQPREAPAVISLALDMVSGNAAKLCLAVERVSGYSRRCGSRADPAS